MSYVVTILSFPFNKIIVLSGAIKRQMPLIFYLGIYFQTMAVSYFPQLSVNNSDGALIQKPVKFLRTLNMQRGEIRVLHFQEEMCVCRAAGEP